MNYAKMLWHQNYTIWVSLRENIIGVATITQVTHVRNKIQGRLQCDKNDFPYAKELLIKERIRSLWEQILSFKRSSHFENGRNWRESILDPVVSL